MVMKKVTFLLSIVSAICFMSCNERYDRVKDFAEEETIYPGMYDYAEAKIGFERVEIDLLRAGRIPSSQIKLGKAKATLVVYDTVSKKFDSLCSWVNITGLNQSKLYRFKIYTLDEYGNRSVSRDTAIIPFTGEDKNMLTIAYPTVTSSPWVAAFNWTSSLSSVLLDYYGLRYSYTDKDGDTHTGTLGTNPQFTAENLEAGSQVTVNLKYRVVPKINGAPILDTVELDQPIYIDMPTSDSYRQNLQNRGIKSYVLKDGNIKLYWNDIPDYTMQYTRVAYINQSDPLNPFADTVRIENSETSSVIMGLQTGSRFSVISNYKPEGVSDVFIDANPRVYNGYANVDLERTDWGSILSHRQVNESPHSRAHIDDDITTFLGLVKPGKSNSGINVAIDEEVWFTVDMQTPQEFDYFRIRHRYNNSGTGLRIWEVSVFGSNDNVSYEPLAMNVTMPNYNVGSIEETPNLDLPRSTFRYVKILYTKWDEVNNSNIQMAEFYLGKR